jgi:hypothetical protein
MFAIDPAHPLSFRQPLLTSHLTCYRVSKPLLFSAFLLELLGIKPKVYSLPFLSLIGAILCQSATFQRGPTTPARKQAAKSLELSATSSLGGLFTKLGHREEARVMAARIYDWFTEGFDTADLKDEKALLDQLSK